MPTLKQNENGFLVSGFLFGESVQEQFSKDEYKEAKACYEQLLILENVKEK